MSTLLNLDLIRTDGGTQPRTGMDYDAVNDYTEAMTAGTVFPPMVVFYDGSSYWLADGFHRYRAAEQAGANEIACDIHQGTQQDAQWYSFGANKTNGLRRTNEDKQRAVKAALAHPKAAAMSDRQIAEHVGVSHETIRAYRPAQSDCQTLTVSRTGRDGRTINVANIGKTASRPAAAPPPDTSPSCPPAPSPAVATTPILSPVPASTPAAVAPLRTTAEVRIAPNPYTEWCTRVVRACMDIANCPVTAKQVATLIAQTNPEFFNHLEKAHESLAAIISSRQ